LPILAKEFETMTTDVILKTRRYCSSLLVLVPCLLSSLVTGGGLAQADEPVQTFYEVEDLGTLPGDTASVAWGINSLGQVVGWSSGPQGTRAFVYTKELGMIELLGLTPQSPGLARDINDHGTVVGQSSGHAVLWDDQGAIRDLGTLGGGEAEATAINAAGDVVGWSSTDGSFSRIHGFLFKPETGMVDITPDADSGFAHDINDLGQVAGYRNWRAFRWENEQFLDLGVLPGDGFSYGFGLNSFGDVTGSSKSASGNRERVFLYTNEQGLSNLGGAGETNSGRRINNSGQVVGTGRPLGGLLRGIVFTKGLGLQGLNEWITSPAEWFVLSASDINDDGVIAATAFSNFLREFHAVRLVPTTDPGCQGHCMQSSIALNAFGLRVRVLVGALVTIADPDGNPLSGATVLAHWTPPSGTAVTAIARTNWLGRARFFAWEGPGTYTFTIDDVTLTGYTFDRANSEVTKSILK
jgi:probable HAF family extracellular repeat protein